MTGDLSSPPRRLRFLAFFSSPPFKSATPTQPDRSRSEKGSVPKTPIAAAPLPSSGRRRLPHSAAPIGRTRPLSTPPRPDPSPRARIASRPRLAMWGLCFWSDWFVGGPCGRVGERGRVGWRRRRLRRRPRVRATRLLIRRCPSRGGRSSTATPGISTSGTRRPRSPSTSAPSRPYPPPRRSGLATPGPRRGRGAAGLPR